MASGTAPASVASTTAQAFQLVVEDRMSAAEGVEIFVLARADRSELPMWAPGAHIDVILDEGLVRQFSLCGDPTDRHTWRIAVLRETEGRGGSTRMHQRIFAGSSIEVRGPRNNFPLEPAPEYLFVAGGIGITPILPMIATVESLGVPWRLLYGGRTRSSMAFRQELGRHGSRVAIRPQDEFGLLELAATLDLVPANAAVYCCGPEALLLAMESACADRPEGSLRVERFTARVQSDALLNTAFEVELRLSGQTLLVPPDKSILEVAEKAGVDVAYSCAEGICGSCETTVIEGVPDHRDSVLNLAERQAGDAMMICVSRCLGTRLVLEI